MTIALITPPAIEPLSLSDVKLHLRIDHAHEDALILETLKAARQYCEFASGQKLITQSWRQYEIHAPESREIDLLLTPVQSIEAITAYDRDGHPTVVAETDFQLQSGSDPAVLLLARTFDPVLAANGFEIDLVVGQGDLGVDVPDTLKRAILLLVAHWYEFRGAVSPQDQPVSIPPGFDALMAPYKRVHL